MAHFTISQTYHFNNDRSERSSYNYFEMMLNVKDPFKDKMPCWMHGYESDSEMERRTR